MQDKAKKMTKWEKKITEFLAKAESDAIEGITAGFETAMPVNIAIRQIAMEQEGTEELEEQVDLDKSGELFPEEDDGAVFEMDLGALHLLSDTEPSQEHPPVPPKEVETQDQQVASQSTVHSVPQSPVLATQSSQGTSVGTLQCLQHVAAMRKRLNTVHQRYFVSAHKLNVQQILESKLCQEKLKLDIQVKKMEKVHVQKLLQQSDVQEHITTPEKHKLELEIFKLEQDILISAGHEAPAPAGIQPLTMNSMFIDVPPKRTLVQMSTVTAGPSGNQQEAVQSAAQTVIHEEIIVPASVEEVHDQVIKDIAENKDVSQVL